MAKFMGMWEGNKDGYKQENESLLIDQLILLAREFKLDFHQYVPIIQQPVCRLVATECAEITPSIIATHCRASRTSKLSDLFENKRQFLHSLKSELNLSTFQEYSVKCQTKNIIDLLFTDVTLRQFFLYAFIKHFISMPTFCAFAINLFRHCHDADAYWQQIKQSLLVQLQKGLIK